MNGKYIVIPEHFEADQANEFRKNLIYLMDKGERNFIIDFSECEFIDCTGLGVFVSIHNRCKKVNGNLKLCEINNLNVKEVFKLTRLDKILLEKN